MRFLPVLFFFFFFFRSPVLLSNACFHLLERDRKTDSPICSSFHIIATVVLARTGKSQELGSPSQSSIKAAGASQDACPVFPQPLAKDQIGRGVAGTQTGACMECWCCMQWLYLLHCNTNLQGPHFEQLLLQSN